MVGSNQRKYMVFAVTMVTVGTLIFYTLDPRNRPEQMYQDVTNERLKQLYVRKLKGMSNEMQTAATHDVSCDKVKGFVEPCIDFRCKSSLTKQPEVLEEIISRRYKIPQQYREVLDNMTTSEDNSQITIVTAASANHYLEAGGMLKSLNEIVLPVLRKYFKVRIFVYDLGLTEKQRKIMKKHCNCTVRDIPFSSLPKYMSNLRSYCWKPIALQAHLPRSEITVWYDASVRFLQGFGIANAINRTLRHGLTVYHGYSSQAQHLHPELVDYFGETHCPFSRYREIISGSVMLHNEEFTQHVVMDTWLSCAFNERCLATTHPAKNWPCDGRLRKYGKCHRFDQSALGMIVLKLFQSKIHNVIGPAYFRFDRTDKTRFFPENL